MVSGIRISCHCYLIVTIMKTDWPATSHSPAVYPGLSPESLIKGEARAQPRAALLLSRHATADLQKAIKVRSLLFMSRTSSTSGTIPPFPASTPNQGALGEGQEENGLGEAKDQARLLPGPALSPVKGQVWRPQAAVDQPRGR